MKACKYLLDEFGGLSSLSIFSELKMFTLSTASNALLWPTQTIEDDCLLSKASCIYD